MTCEYEGGPFGPCEGEVKLRSAMTAYHFEGCRNSPEDPNREFSACDSCYQEYAAHWSEAWREHNQDIMDGIRDAEYQERIREYEDREQQRHDWEQQRLEAESFSSDRYNRDEDYYE